MMYTFGPRQLRYVMPKISEELTNLKENKTVCNTQYSQFKTVGKEIEDIEKLIANDSLNTNILVKQRHGKLMEFINPILEKQTRDKSRAEEIEKREKKSLDIKDKGINIGSRLGYSQWDKLKRELSNSVEDDNNVTNNDGSDDEMVKYAKADCEINLLDLGMPVNLYDALQHKSNEGKLNYIQLSKMGKHLGDVCRGFRMSDTYWSILFCNDKKLSFKEVKKLIIKREVANVIIGENQIKKSILKDKGKVKELKSLAIKYKRSITIIGSSDPLRISLYDDFYKEVDNDKNEITLRSTSGEPFYHRKVKKKQLFDETPFTVSNARRAIFKLHLRNMLK